MNEKAKRHQRFLVEYMGISAKTLFAEEARLLDISMAGACISAEESLTFADKYLMKLYKNGTPLTLQCRALWETARRELKDRSAGSAAAYNAGVAFEKASFDSLRMLKDYICVSSIPNQQRLSDKYKPRALRFKVYTNEKALVYYSKIAHVKELSLSGMLMELDKGIPVGQRFPMGLFLPNENLPIKFQGRVACCIELPDTASKRFDIGIQFLSLAEEDKRRLSTFLETLIVPPLYESLPGLPRKASFFTKKTLSMFVLVCGVATALAAAFYFSASYIHNARGTKLNLARMQDNEPLEKNEVRNAGADKATEVSSLSPSAADSRIEEQRANPAQAAQQAKIAAAGGASTATSQAPKEQERSKYRTSELPLQAEKGRATRSQPEEQTAPRRLSANQRSLLTGLLKANPGQIAIAAHGNDAEAWNFARNIAESAHEAGWTIQAVNQPVVNIPPGLTIAVPNVEPRPPHAGLLRMSLKDIGFDAGWSVDQNIQIGSILLLVGANLK